MKVSDFALSYMAEHYPHSIGIVKAFIPLYEVKESVAESYALPTLPDVDTLSFAQGKAFLLPVDHKELYLDEGFLQKIHHGIIEAIKEGFPHIADEVLLLETLIATDQSLPQQLARFALQGEGFQGFSEQHSIPEELVRLYATSLFDVAAKRVALAVQEHMPVTADGESIQWVYHYCPVCGAKPHASYIKNKEGQRFLQCASCHSQWQYSRTACPSCAQDTLNELPLFFFEKNMTERAEACEVCKHYILSLDTRNMSGDVPLELLLLCLVPIDILMQEKGYVPVKG